MFVRLSNLILKARTSSIFSSLFSSSLALLIGASSLYYGTDGWRAWTSESARRLHVLENSIQLPAFYLTNQDGEVVIYQRNAPLGAKPSITLLEFIFTRCPTICLAMGAEFNQLQSTLSSNDKYNRVNLLSISFDPRDSVDDLDDYLSHFNADKNRWSSARFNHPEQLNFVMKKLGAIAIPEPDFGFVHNAAVYVLKNNRIIAILDHTDRKGLLKLIDQELQVAEQLENIEKWSKVDT